jgi:hypothetical protein
MNVFDEQRGRIALYASPRTKEGATIAMLVELIGYAVPYPPPQSLSTNNTDNPVASTSSTASKTSNTTMQARTPVSLSSSTSPAKAKRPVYLA